MAVHIDADGDLARRLTDIINPKLIEVGWSTGAEGDNDVSEYIILMLANGKNQQELATELSSDLLSLEPGDTSALDFSSWLFQQIEDLNNQPYPPTSIPQNSSDIPSDMHMEGTTPSVDGQTQDSSDRRIPTGPKAMRGGRGNRLNQINRQMDRGSDSALHRIQGGGGIGRASSRDNRGNARGSKGQQINRNFDGANRRAQKNAGMAPGNFNNFPMQNGGPMNQAQILQMLEHQAALMTQLASSHGLMNPAFVPPNAQFQQSHQNGRPLGDRIGRGGQNRKPQRRHGENAPQGDTAMGEDGEPVAASGDNEGSGDPATTVCKFNLYCTKADCQFAHQSSAAPPGTALDLSVECDFGVACKNYKCVSKHPSPAKKFEHQQQQECKFGPFCQNPRCTFKHSTSKPCRNGGDCTTAGCTFFHSPIECKFSPCTNQHCIYKHKDGQKAVAPGGNVWTPNGEHVSERKFVNEEQEELIIPGSGSQMEAETAQAA